MIIPTLRYHNSKQALEWLQKAFGLDVAMTIENEDGSVAHAELWSGDGCVMIGQMHDVVPWHPEPGTASVYIVIRDVESHFETAKAAGAEVLEEPYDTDYGSREYTVRDPEGNVWSFGTFRPERPS